MERETSPHPQGRVRPESTQRHPSPADPGERPRLRHILVCIFVLKLLTQFTFALLELPLVRLAEDLVCQSLIGAASHNLGESRCKSDLVQNETARIIGLKTAFDAIPCRNKFASASISTDELRKVF